MNKDIQNIYKSFISVFNTYEISDESLKKELKKWKKDFKDFSENINDSVDFNNEYWGSELDERHSNLLNKIATISLGYSMEDILKINEKATLPTLEEFVEQYRAGYNKVKKAAYRKNGELVYEQLFHVLKRTNDVFEGQIIIEKEKLRWKIVKEDFLDVFKPILEAMDPLFHSTYTPLSMDINVYENVESEEELNYYLEINKVKKIKSSQDHFIKIGLILLIQHYTLKYLREKENLYRNLNKISKNTIKKLIIERNALKRAVNSLQDFNLTINDLFNDESLKIWLIFKQTIDLSGKFKFVNNPKNYLSIYEILTKEIIPDIPIYEVLLRTPENIFYPPLNYLKEEKYFYNAKKKVNKINSKLTYYKYNVNLHFESENHINLGNLINYMNFLRINYFKNYYDF